MSCGVVGGVGGAEEKMPLVIEEFSIVLALSSVDSDCIQGR